MEQKVLIVDDSPMQVFALENIIRKKLGLGVKTAEDGEEAVRLATGEEDRENIRLVLMDVFLPKMNGLEALQIIKRRRPDLPVIIVTGDDDEEIAHKAMRWGATDFIRKGESEKRITQSIQSVVQGHQLQNEAARLQSAFSSKQGFEAIIGGSAVLRKAMEFAHKAAGSDIPVMLTGESGVGKEMFAKAIHYTGNRADKPLVVVNCGAIPENLAESTLFGHEKGAFTGATQKQTGKFQEADGGTLFLDEIGELKPDMQVKLLRAIQEGEVESVGGKKPVKVNVRIISATNRDLEEAVRSGGFRKDLYYRLNVLPVLIPSLRERGEKDIAMLVEHFRRRITATEHKNIGTITPAAMALLTRYSWPGNVRQLENVMFRAIVLAKEGVLDVDDFTQISNSLLKEKSTLMEQSVRNIESSVPYMPHAVFTPVSSSGGMMIPTMNQNGDIRTVSEVEEDMIRAALDLYNWRTVKVARKLGVSRTTLYRKMKKMGLEDPNRD